jgi:lipid-A-disaccharide synthase
MTPKTIMVVAGDPSGDANAADLVRALAGAVPDAQFIGAGGPGMAEAGVQLSFNLTDDAAIGPVDAIKNLGSFWRRRRHLATLAKERRPELIILVDAYTFNQPLARVIKNFVRASGSNWQPKIVRYTSPQVWASRPGRAEKMAGDIDLLLCLYPFEKDWYARRGTPMRVEFVGHPIFDRHAAPTDANRPAEEQPTIVLLPGSRTDELKRHLPVMLAAAREINAIRPVRFKLVALNEKMADYMRSFQAAGPPEMEIQTGHLADALSAATLAITKTGTISLECAYFGVPTLAMYKASIPFYLLARSFVTVKYLAMPNLLADEPLFPEFIQGRATAQNLAKAALELLADAPRRSAIRAKLRRVIESLGGPGSTRRAAAIILQLMGTPWNAASGTPSQTLNPA